MAPGDIAIPTNDPPLLSSTSPSRYHFLSNLHKEPPCSYPIYNSTDTIFINSRRQLQPVVECLDFLHHVTKKFEPSTKQNLSKKRALFSTSSVFDKDFFKSLEVDPKWAEQRQFRLVGEQLTKLSDRQFTEDTETNPVSKDILGDDANGVLKSLRSKIDEMPLDELAEVVLPVLVERFSPADILIAQSRNESCNNEIDVNTLENNVQKCKRQLTWINNNSKTVDDEPPEKQRRAILTTNPNDEDEEILLFDDEHQIDVENISLELKLVLDAIKMLKTSTDAPGSSDMIKSGFYQDFKRFDLGKSTWAPPHQQPHFKQTAEQKTEFYERVSSLADTTNQYIFSTTANDE